jgi:AcrR family transcriptional regulator
MTQAPAKPSRQAAHLARRRVELIAAAQHTVAESGPEAPIEQFAADAGVSIATLYKHFGSKDGLLAAAAVDGLQRWEAWMAVTVSVLPTEIEQFVAAGRLVLRGHDLQPELSSMGARILATTRIDVGILISEMSERVERLVAEGVVLSDQTDLRMRLYLACLINEFLRQASLPKPKPDEADAVVELALTLLGVTPARAKKLVGTPLPPLGELQK